MDRKNRNLFALQKGTVAILCIVCMLSSIILGCEKKTDKKDESNILLGKWQLKTISPLNVEGGVIFMLVDFSPMNIIYEFTANNVLKVSSNVDNINYGGLEIGKHFYEITLTNIRNGILVTDLAQHVVEINTIPYCFCIGNMSDDPALFLTCYGECNSMFTFIKK